MDWDSLIGGFMSSPLIILILAVVGRVWPDTLTSLSTWMYSHVDPGRLPHDSEVNRHWARTHDLGVRMDRLDAQMVEVRKDQIKAVLIQLMSDKDHDRSTEVRYELSKLEALHADCWIMDYARDYLRSHISRQQQQ